ncbi:MAG: tRNA (guanosine(46)-N7)-methyltransferase TrmB [Candidatus Nanoperiomorbus sp.]
MMNIDPSLEPDNYIITRKRKLYKFASFARLANCYSETKWQEAKQSILHDSLPVTLEVGAGDGLFLTKLAEDHPEQQFIALDRKSDRLYRGAKLASESKLTNILYLWSNADNLRRLLPDQLIQTIWLTFPDPWPQESNIKHRLTNRQHLLSYHQLLAPNGRLKLKTDNDSLFDWSIQQFTTEKWQIDRISHDLYGDKIAGDATVKTTYEERYLAEGKKINYLAAGKI